MLKVYNERLEVLDTSEVPVTTNLFFYIKAAQETRVYLPKVLFQTSIEAVFPKKNKTDVEKLKTKLSEKMKGWKGNPTEIL